MTIVRILIVQNLMMSTYKELVSELKKRKKDGENLVVWLRVSDRVKARSIKTSGELSSDNHGLLLLV